jgi:hypothetical protein
MVRTLAFTCILFLLTACQKEISFEGQLPPLPEEIPLTYIRCKIDGATKTFNILAKATRQSSSGQHVLSIFGKSTDQNTDVERINLGISSSEAIGVGTFTEADPAFIYVVDAVYNPDNITDIWAVGFHPNPSNPFRIVITDLNANFVKGTFRGDLFNNGGAGGNKIVLTEGEFSVPF